MPHMTFEAIAFIFAIIVWVISSIVKGLKWLNTQLGGTNTRPALVQAAAPKAQADPARTVSPARTSAPAASYKTSASDFISQEQALQAEAASDRRVPPSNAPLGNAPLPRPAQAAPLFGNTDDLVRAIILQEALGPPLSKRKSSPSHPPA